MDIILNILVAVLGIGILLLGLKGFSKDGLPLTYYRRMRGPFAAFIGAICVVLGASWVILGLWLAARAPM